MFSKEIYIARRAQLKKQLSDGILLFMGNNEVGMNYSANTYHFRQDSSFLYYFGIDRPGLNAIIDLEDGSEFVFGDDPGIEDIVWVGAKPVLAEVVAQVGVEQTQPASALEGILEKAVKAGKTVHFLPPYRHENILKLSEWLSIPANQVKTKASPDFVKAIVGQRSHKGHEEIEEMDLAVTISGAMHVAAMKAARPGKKESFLTGIVHGIAVGMGGDLAYPVILSKDGQTLHNHYHGNTLEAGDLVLGDFGAETAMHYAGDLTRTFPVSKKFTTKQKEVYEIVLDAQVKSIEAVRPGITYKEVHLLASKIMANGLKSIGLMKGDMDEAVAAGAHALFFPHGLGHMIGLDVHDMEDLGEDLVGYSETVKRSEQFGTAYLRLGRELEKGFVLTVEPGLYFIPELIDIWQGEKKFEEFINYEKVNTFRDFGGIRIEDNVVVTDSGYRVLGRNPVPKTIEEVESLR